MSKIEVRRKAVVVIKEDSSAVEYVYEIPTLEDENAPSLLEELGYEYYLGEREDLNGIYKVDIVLTYYKYWTDCGFEHDMEFRLENFEFVDV